MRGNRISPRAKRRVQDHRSEAVNRFEHRILADGVYDDIVQDSQLAQLENAVATIEDVRDERRDTVEGTRDDVPSATGLADAVEAVHPTIADRVDEICAERCKAVLVNGDEWVDEGWEDREDVNAAKREANEWLLEHEDVARRLWSEDEDPILTEADA